ncbi:glycosyltransferase [Pseudomonas sp. SMV71]|uniref:glycosyltransferase n=1 Tax=Pseudomonas sp. SMV71 TaxID=3390195 RepID=UPI003F83E85B
MPIAQPQVAVLLAAYNGMRWIGEQLDSILRQSTVHVTVYISVDPSCDGTEQWCAEATQRYDNVVLLPPAGRFGGASRNFFRLLRDVDFSGFDYIAFSDQDDIWHLDKLERAVQAIKSRQAHAYSSNVTALWPNGDRHLLNKAQPQAQWDFIFEAAGPGCTYVLCQELAESMKSSMLANWNLLQQVSLHDWYCYAFARSHGYSWYIDPKPAMEYRQHSNNQVGANKGVRPLIARYRRIYQGWWFSQVKLIVALVGLEKDPFVSSWYSLGRMQLIYLSFKAAHCRRRLRDKLLFFAVCWAAVLLGRNYP